jgi:SAM-dependent methyltransferase
MNRSLANAWDDSAADWIDWARTPGHDSYWTFHRQRFLDLVPEPGRLTLDVGCGEGRVGRDLATSGHNVVGVDASPRLVEACVQHEGGHPAVLGNASQLPIAGDAADVVVGFMSFHDLDRLEPAIAEVRRVLRPGGRVHLAIVHPTNSAGNWRESNSATREPPAFVIDGSYMHSRRYADDVESDGLTMTFHGMHRPLSIYTNLLTENGLMIERLDEITDTDPASKWFRIPLFLHLIARRV